MIDIFDPVEKFFASLQGFDINLNLSFILFVGLFLFTALCVLIATANAYESKLAKTVDLFNDYFMQNPYINEENLLAFNNTMKSKKVPKQLRKQWQQYVLYREGKASEYMSYEKCVTIPSKNSSYIRSITFMNLLAYIFATCAFLLNLYVAYEVDVIYVLQKSAIAPALILIVNYVLTIFLKLRHNAITLDLQQNYQYFEVNIDKATQTLPEYVDYEVLFDKNEIKKGIPILYAYLQKRAEEEQRELELARLRNVEHEKFNFDEAGVAGSLVLERAMQEAENYIAERKKYNQDTEQINSDITQEDMNYREITKEYNRQMQVSKETFANFKSQLEEASSTIEANYLKKQQQQELDRQRNLERDFDTATERHKKVIASYHEELDDVDKFRAQSRKVLEDAMMSEFETYSSKVYDEAKKVVEEREKEKYAKIQNQIKELEEKLFNKEQELEKAYGENQVLNEKLENASTAQPQVVYQPQPQPVYQEPVQQEQVYQEPEYQQPTYEEAPVEEQPAQVYQPLQYSEPEVPSYEKFEDNVQEQNETYNDVDEVSAEENNYEEFDAEDEESGNYFDFEIENEETPAEEETVSEEPAEDKEEETNFADFFKVNDTEEDSESDEESSSEGGEELTFDDIFKVNSSDDWNELEEDEEGEEEGALEVTAPDMEDFFKHSVVEEADEPVEEVEEAPALREEELVQFFKDEVAKEDLKNEDIKVNADDLFKFFKTDAEDEESGAEENISTNQNESEMSGVTKRKAGRPRKVVTEEDNKPKKKPGRPKKVKEEAVSSEPKRGRGRPKKEVKVEAAEPKKGRGRPKKEVKVEATEPKKGRGRPKKVETATTEKPAVKKGRGRPKKVQETSKKKTKAVVKAGRGRPKKTAEQFKNIEDIDAYLKEIDNVIAQENAKFEASKKALEKKANIKKKK